MYLTVICTNSIFHSNGMLIASPWLEVSAEDFNHITSSSEEEKFWIQKYTWNETNKTWLTSGI